MDSRAAQSARTKREYNISLDMQMSVAQLHATAYFDIYHRNESYLNACVSNIDNYITDENYLVNRKRK